MKKTLIVLTIFALVISGCMSASEPTIVSAANEPTATNAISNQSTILYEALACDDNQGTQPIETQTVSLNQTELNKPKYIFLLIGDGFGLGHMRMGEMYARIENEDMDAEAVWESFDVQQMIKGASESACGGTALATGYMGKPSAISINRDNEDLVTILDRAHENGMSTGVVTNSNIQDATPATFLAHADSRLDEREISEGLVYSDVDYIAGGGMNYVITREQAKDFDYVDCSLNELTPNRFYTYQGLLDEGYKTYLGLQGAKDFLSDIENETFINTKTTAIFSELVMPYEPTKYLENYVDRMKYVPDLVDMTEAGIQILSQNPNGFIMMIEEALIDKAEHRDRMITSAMQVSLIDRTLAQIQAFTESHPGEVLIILTADHETGLYRVNEEKFDTFLNLPDFIWTHNAQDMHDFLTNEWALNISLDRLYDRLRLYEKDLWETEREKRTPTVAEVTYITAQQYGIRSHADTHTFEPVPCYTAGAGAENFIGIERIEQIPIVICEMMGWAPLPAVDKEAAN